MKTRPLPAMITKLVDRLLTPKRQQPSFNYSLRRSARAKNTRIVVKAGTVEVVAPPHVSERSINNFVSAKQAWIEQALQRIATRIDSINSLAPTYYVDGVLIPYQGRQLPLSIKQTSGKTLKVQLLADNEFLLYLPTSFHADHSSEHIRLALQRWMKQHARQHAELLINRHATRFDLHPRSLRIKTQKSRWGSCGPQNDINLNWLLMLAPPIVMEYVVIHELCHIRHKNHSREFWSLVEQIMPDYPHHRRWLKQHGASLMRGL